MADARHGATIEVDGALTRVIARDASGVTVAAVALADLTTVTAVGELGDLALGTPLRLIGRWADAARRELRVADYHLRDPDDAEGIRRFLGSGFFPGVGRGLAGRIVAHLGAETLRVIASHPTRLLEVPGVGAARQARLVARYAQHRHLVDTMTLLRAHGATPAFTSRMGRHGGAAIWLPTSPALVAAMLDLGQVTAADRVIDLGAGDGVIVIAAARRGARALGIESNPELIERARRGAHEAGVAHLAEFAQADLFEADLTSATVITLFLGSAVNRALRPRLLGLAPGTRIVSNAWSMADWTADEVASVAAAADGFRSARLWIVPARLDGAWRGPDGTLTLAQTYQVLTGTFSFGATTVEVTDGRVRGARFELRVGAARYAGALVEGALDGTVERDGVTRAWRATRARSAAATV